MPIVHSGNNESDSESWETQHHTMPVNDTRNDFPI